MMKLKEYNHVLQTAFVISTCLLGKSLCFGLKWFRSIPYSQVRYYTHLLCTAYEWKLTIPCWRIKFSKELLNVVDQGLKMTVFIYLWWSFRNLVCSCYKSCWNEFYKADFFSNMNMALMLRDFDRIMFKHHNDKPDMIAWILYQITSTLFKFLCTMDKNSHSL